MTEQSTPTASEQIDLMIAKHTDWRGEMVSTVRRVILAADPEIFEEWKWMGSPVWSCDGVIAVGNAHKDKVKLTFSHGASLPDPHGLFNNGFGGKVWRAIDIRDGERIDEQALTTLVRAAAEYNRNKPKAKSARRPQAKVSQTKG